MMPYINSAAHSLQQPSPTKALANNQNGEGGSGDVDKIKAAVKQLMVESDVRPAVVEGRSASDPVKPFNEGALRHFVSALQQEESVE